MKKFKYERFIAFIISIIVTVSISLTSCTAAQTGAGVNPLTDIQKNIIIQELIEKGDFVGLFERASQIGLKKHIHEGGNYFIETAVSTYIHACCHSKALIVELLEENDFDVSFVKYLRNVSPNNWPHDERGRPYEEVIVGTKKTSSFSPYSRRVYAVEFYFSHEEVKVGLAHTYGDSF